MFQFSPQGLAILVVAPQQADDGFNHLSGINNQSKWDEDVNNDIRGTTVCGETVDKEIS